MIRFLASSHLTVPSPIQDLLPDIISALTLDEISCVLSFITEWNTNSRHRCVSLYSVCESECECTISFADRLNFCFFFVVASRRAIHHLANSVHTPPSHIFFFRDRCPSKPFPPSYPSAFSLRLASWLSTCSRLSSRRSCRLRC